MVASQLAGYLAGWIANNFTLAVYCRDISDSKMLEAKTRNLTANGKINNVILLHQYYYYYYYINIYITTTISII